MAQNRPVRIVGSFRGPVTGVTVINQKLLELLQMRGLRASGIDLSPGGKGMARHLVRTFRTLNGAFRVLFSVTATRYIMSLDGGLGLVYNILLAAIIRLRGGALLLYHHSSSYIVSDSRLIRILLWLTKDNTRHVMCSTAMLSVFRHRYGAHLHGFIVSNAAWISPAKTVESAESGVLRLGHLSGLTSEKGMVRAFETLRTISRRGHAAELVLAGSPQDAEAKQDLLDAQKEFGAALCYAGVLSGDAKAAFYASVDYFLFPSLYRHETQSLVVPEALAAGVPVIAYDHRFVGEVLNSGGLLVPHDKPFASTAADWILSGDLRERRTMARAQAEKSRLEAAGQLDTVVDWACGAASPEAGYN